MNHDTIVTIIVTATIAIMLCSWFYEHELKQMVNQVTAGDEARMNLIYDKMVLQAELDQLRDASWSFGEAAAKFGNGVSNEDLATLFDQDLMLGNND